jgi:hypothetical protein
MEANKNGPVLEAGPFLLALDLKVPARDGKRSWPNAVKTLTFLAPFQIATVRLTLADAWAFHDAS